MIVQNRSKSIMKPRRGDGYKLKTEYCIALTRMPRKQLPRTHASSSYTTVVMPLYQAIRLECSTRALPESVIMRQRFVPFHQVDNFRSPFMTDRVIFTTCNSNYSSSFVRNGTKPFGDLFFRDIHVADKLENFCTIS